MTKLPSPTWNELRSRVRILCPLILLLTSLPAPSIAATAPTVRESPEDRAAALVEEALALGEEELEGAAERIRAALELYRQLGDLRGQANAELFLATVEDRRGDREAAIAHLEKSLPLLRRLGDEMGVWLALTLASEGEQGRGGFAAVRRYSGEALAVLDGIESSGEPVDTATLVAYGEQSYCPNAAGWAQLGALPPLMRGMVFRIFRTLNRQALAGAQRELGELEASLATYRRILASEPPEAEWKLEARRAAGELAHELGRHPEAREHFGVALELARGAALWEQEVAILNHLANLEADLDHPAAALESHREALEIARLMAHEKLEAEILRRMAELHRAAGRADEARELLRRALDVALVAGDEEETEKAQQALGALEAGGEPGR